ncbi:hypothetical protein IHN57_01590 [Deinococcus sp. 6GRE01]|nr:hypothetical protein [Deinococcus sp. 6GRE01]
MTSSDTARLHADTLADHLQTHLPHRRVDALKRLAEVLLAVLQAESTDILQFEKRTSGTTLWPQNEV